MKHTIGNGRLEIAFDDATGEIASLVNRLTGDDAVKHAVRQPLFKLYTMERDALSGERTEWLPGAIRHAEATENRETGAAKLSIELEDSAYGSDEQAISIRALVTIELEADACESVWKLELTNRDARHRIVEVMFPYVRGLGLGERWDDDTLIYPHHAGEKTDNPVLQYASDKYRNFWRAQSVREEDGSFSREINYCGLASMTWMYLYDRDNGLYVGSHDERFPLTGLRVETGGPDNPWIGFGFRKYMAIREGETWSSGPAVVALTALDWRWGAKRYRQWIDRHIDMPVNPSFLDGEYVLNQCYNFKRGDHIANRFENIPAMYRAGKEQYGMNHMFIASWNRKGFDRDYPEYQPDMELGTPWELFEGCRAVNEAGGFVTFYINARIFDKDHDFFPTLGKKWAIKDHRHSFMNETYGPVEFTVCCPSHEEWQQYLIDMSRWMVRSYGATGIYLDQLGSADPYPCYDPDHSHRDIGEFNTGYLRVLRELQPELRNLNPGCFLMIENCGDIYGSYVWGNLTWNGEKYDEFFNLYKYTFPEYVQVNMVNPRRGLEGEELEKKLRWDIARAMLIGSVFWIGMYRFEGPENASMHRFLIQALALRKSLQKYVCRGHYADADEVLAVSPGVDIARWKLGDGEDLYILANLDCREEAYFELPLPEEASVAVIGADTDNLSGTTEAVCTKSKGVLRLSVPTAAISYRLVKSSG